MLRSVPGLESQAPGAYLLRPAYLLDGDQLEVRFPIGHGREDGEDGDRHPVLLQPEESDCDHPRLKLVKMDKLRPGFFQ